LTEGLSILSPSNQIDLATNFPAHVQLCEATDTSLLASGAAADIGCTFFCPKRLARDLTSLDILVELKQLRHQLNPQGHLPRFYFVA
jgi:hypothetical protein